METGHILGSPAEAIVPVCHWAQLDLGHLQWSRNNLRLLSMTFTQEVSITVDELWKCIFMCLFGGVCVVIMCVFQSSSTSWCQTEHPSPTILASCRLPSAVRRTGDCCLGDHYRGHKRAIYRTTSEWSQHSYPPPARAGLHRAGSPMRSPKQRVQQGTKWLKHEGPGTVRKWRKGIIDARSKLNLVCIQ